MKKISGLFLLTIISFYTIASRKTTNHLCPVQKTNGICTHKGISNKTTNNKKITIGQMRNLSDFIFYQLLKNRKFF
jgi:hypothetical protein